MMIVARAIILLSTPRNVFSLSCHLVAFPQVFAGVVALEGSFDEVAEAGCTLLVRVYYAVRHGRQRELERAGTGDEEWRFAARQ